MHCCCTVTFVSARLYFIYEGKSVPLGKTLVNIFQSLLMYYMFSKVSSINKVLQTIEIESISLMSVIVM